MVFKQFLAGIESVLRPSVRMNQIRKDSRILTQWIHHYRFPHVLLYPETAGNPSDQIKVGATIQAAVRTGDVGNVRDPDLIDDILVKLTVQEVIFDRWFF